MMLRLPGATITFVHETIRIMNTCHYAKVLQFYNNPDLVQINLVQGISLHKITGVVPSHNAMLPISKK